MDLSNLYSLRRDFIIVGLTGRTGSGSSTVANILSKDYEEIEKGLRDESKFKDKIFSKKYKICKDYLSYNNNWKPFEVIKYRDVILFYLLSDIGSDYAKLKDILLQYFNDFTGESKSIARSAIREVEKIHLKYQHQIVAIKKFKDKFISFKDISKDADLIKLEDLFFGEDFIKISKEINNALILKGYFRRTRLLHHIASNIRKHGNSSKSEINDISKIYTLAHLVNRLIKSKKHVNKIKSKPTRIVIDSLRNSLEIMFFKERYSGFYLLATKDTKKRVTKNLHNRFKKLKYNDIECEKIVNKLLKLDEIEYKTKDFERGEFSAPDVENCIQKSDVHILNLELSDIDEYNRLELKTEVFFSREEQLLKIISLISHPGIITPSSLERNMHMAFVAKSNSGCISRQVGAVITNKYHSIKSIGWNDVAAGSTPCNLRSVNDFLEDIKDNEHYSDFEKGINIEESNYKYKERVPFSFNLAVQKYYHLDVSLQGKMKGMNCSFCFKSIHNFYEDERNQVHTRSLHAEENAMLQIAKYGGEKLIEGKLFTTASPCELCSKKAFQIGVREVYYIDPYPGISKSHILNTGKEINRLKMIPFYGIIGKSYHKLFEPFMSYKDEINLMIENDPDPVDIKLPSLSNFKNDKVKGFLNECIVNGKIDIECLEKNLLDKINQESE